MFMPMPWLCHALKPAETAAKGNLSVMALPAFPSRKLPLIAGVVAVGIIKPELLAAVLGLAVVAIIGGVIYIAIFSRDPERRKIAVKLIKAIFGRK
jgi:hypothetical protein